MYMYVYVKLLYSHTHLDLRGVGIPTHCNGDRELLHEDRESAQLAGEDKVKQ